MRQMRIWVLYISFLLVAQLSTAQENKDIISIEPLDSLSSQEKIPLKLRLGVDLYRIILSQVNDNFNGYEVVGDFQISEDLFLALELTLLDKIFSSWPFSSLNLIVLPVTGSVTENSPNSSGLSESFLYLI